MAGVVRIIRTRFLFLAVMALLLGAGLGVSVALAPIWSRGGIRNDGALPDEVEVQTGLMGPAEQEAYVAAFQAYAKWRKKQITADQLNETIGLVDRDVEVSIAVPQHQLRLGQQPSFAFVLRNTSSKPCTFFALRMFRLSDRGRGQDGVRKDVLDFAETPFHDGYIQLIPPGDTLVLPQLLPAQPSGAYVVEVVLETARYGGNGDGPRGLRRAVLYRGTISFEIGQ